MKSNEANGGHPAVLSTAGLCVGGRVRLLKDIWDDGGDHHPPGLIARAGEVIIIRRVHDTGARRSIAVSHEHVKDNSFTVYSGEYETHNVK